MRGGQGRGGPLAGRFALAFCAASRRAMAGSSEVKESLEEADETLSGALDGADTTAFDGLAGADLAAALYDTGLKLKSEGKDAEAFSHFEQAAERGHGPAAYELAEAYRSEEHTSELQSLMRISYAVFCLKKKNLSST